jgi:hypothetical protein
MTMLATTPLLRAPATPVEEVPPGEASAIAEMIAGLEDQLTSRYERTTMRRDAHPKTLGLVNARFTISDECPPELCYGVFARPGDSFDALIRFSNGNPVREHDMAFDIRGMAIKLPGVAGAFLEGEPGQDFVLATGESFFGIDAVEYKDFIPASTSPIALLKHFLRWGRFRAGANFLSAQCVPRSPLAIEYFSQTPYRLGPHVVKYRARAIAPRSTRHDPGYMRPINRRVLGVLARLWPRFASRFAPPDAVRLALVDDLARGPVAFEFLVQRWPDLRRLPPWAIENATLAWPAPWSRVATILMDALPASDVDAAEPMTFTPWHAKAEHQPLGSINRARYAIYKHMSDFRRCHNGPALGGAPRPAGAVTP